MLALVFGVALLACGDSSDDPGNDAGMNGNDAEVNNNNNDNQNQNQNQLPPGAVETESGVVQGEDLDTVWGYRGIPYAAPPVGDLRFRAPQAHVGWADTLDATAFGPWCPQPRSGAILGDEDCLTANVWAPKAPATPRPVMVFVHGGSFVWYAGGMPGFEGADLATNGDVVVVTFNYRLGTLGFLATEALAAESGSDSAGSYGFLDQVFLLEWVQSNIAAFGGDPTQVMIFGESAGGISVCAHLGSPLSAGLFSKAAVQSGTGCVGFRSLRGDPTTGPNGITVGEAVVAAVGCDQAADELTCLRELPANALVAAAADAPTNVIGGPAYSPLIDGTVLTDDPLPLLAAGQGNGVPTIIGSNANEALTLTASVDVPDATTFGAILVGTLGATLAPEVLALYPVGDYVNAKAAYNAFVSDWLFVCPTLGFAAYTQAAGLSTWVYHVEHTFGAPYDVYGSFHGLELFLLFRTFEEVEGYLGQAYTPVQEDQDCADAAQAAWTGFATTGTPTFTPAWPAYDAASPHIAIIDVPTSSATEIRGGRCAQLQTLGLVP